MQQLMEADVIAARSRRGMYDDRTATTARSGSVRNDVSEASSSCD